MKRKKKKCKYRDNRLSKDPSKRYSIYQSPPHGYSFQMFEQKSNNIYSNWGAASSFSARSNESGKPAGFSKPGAGNFFLFKESNTEFKNESSSLKKTFNLFGNSSDSKKQNSWSQIQDSSTGAQSSFKPSAGNQEKSHIESSGFASALYGDRRSDGKIDSLNKSNSFGNNPPPTNLTIHRNNGVASFSIKGSDTSLSDSVAVPSSNNAPAPPKSRLGKLFSYFKRDKKAKDKIQSVFKTPYVTPKTLSSPSYKAIDTRRIGSMRRLVLKSKPTKYHLIDVNKVLSSKRGVAVPTNMSATKLLTEESPQDNEMNDADEEVEYKSFAANVVEQTAKDEGKTSNKDANDKQDEYKTTVQKYNGYWTYPPIDEISEMNPSSLENVHNFIIGRVGYGQIAYDYPVNLTNVVSGAESNGRSLAEELFDNIVTVKQSAVLVYKNIEDKPPLGSNLNVPATITLEGIKPKPSVSMQDHINYLKRQIGMEFVTYDPITYVWVFKVKHFSIWGLVDEDDDDQKDLVSLKRKQDLREAEALAEYSKVYSDGSFDQEVKKQKLNEYTKIFPGDWGSTLPPNDSLLKLKRSLVTDEIAEVLNQYRDFEDDTMAGKVNSITIDSDSDSDEVEEIEEVKLNAYEPVITDVAVFNDIKNKSTFPTTDNWLLQLELANQYNSAMAPMAPENNFSKGKLTMSKVDELLFPNSGKGNKSASKKKGSEWPKVPLNDVSADIIQIVFDNLINDCQFKQSDNSMPQLEAEGLNFARLINKTEKTVSNLQIELASILFDQNNDSDNDRLILLGQWLQKYNQAQIEDLLEANQTDDLYCAFLYLCVNLKEKAIERAWKSKNEHLAVILFQADSNDIFVKDLAAEQIETWQRPRCIEYIPKSLIKIYQLLARQMDKVSENLTWSIVMGIYLYYGDAESIKDLLNEYKFILPEGDPTADLLRLYLRGVNYTTVRSSKLSSPLKWIFCLILADFNYDEVSTDLGNSLEKADLWKEALVVFSSIEDDNTKTKLIRNLIITKTEEEKIDEHDEKYLTTVLKVPRSLLHEAKASERKNAGDYWSEVNALIEANFWSKAHETIVTQLGPEVVITNSPTNVTKLMNVINQFPQHGSIISSWNKGAGIYQNYFKLIENTEDSEIIIFLMEFLPLTKPESTKQKLAIVTIAKFVGDLALENKRVPANQRQRILQMPLDKVDKAYFELRLSRAN
ncbi:Nup145 protein [Candida orthopsilosis Co 90-125]|uniref:Nup145 protein n=1 Tax=Candida orthopsilosis (strain 90-125) TaxID=1136231 RepID=H8WZ89_CANO9|nr:Nup145 protein [Candida orthopsilosis Co 90-125]CCG21757.1 Nup145 protein [Candida orthopsilosis Co 90-125]